MFDLVAEKYDAYYDNPIGKKVDELEKLAMDEILGEGCDGKLVLEIGSGTGHWSKFFSEKGCRVVGIDLSRVMLEVAVNKGIKDTKFLVADAVQLPFKDVSFDCSVVITSLEFIEDFKKVVAEMNRCTKKDGKIVIGALNKYSFMSLKRKITKSPLFSKAHFFSYYELRKLLRSIGNVKIVSSVFFLPYKIFLRSADIVERIGKNIFKIFGNFLIATVEKK